MKRIILVTGVQLLFWIICQVSAFVPPNVLCTAPRRNHNIRPTNRLFGGMESLATEGDWTAYLDEENTGLIYYFNGKTGESVWEKPTVSFPDVALAGTLKRKAYEKQEEYLKSLQENNPNLKKGFLRTILDTTSSTDTNAATISEAAKAKMDDTDWFSPIFEQSTAPAIEEKPKRDNENLDKNTESNERFASIFDASADKTKEKDIGFFGSMFGSTKESTGKDPETTSKIEVKEGGKPLDVGGFFGSIFKTITTPDTIIEDSTTTKAKLTPKEIVTSPSITTTTNAETPIKIESAAYVLPHPAKVFWGGEDAVFIKGRTFGVFDGVSGATKLDGIPLYSKTLANEMKKLIPNDQTALSSPDLTRILAQCAETADQIATGASTAVVASIGHDGFLRAVNVGDSTCIIVRDGKVVAKTREISHYFECPYQLSVDSPDRPKDGTKLNVELMRGDIICMASDGVFDNLSEVDVAEIINKEKQLSTIAKRVSEMSRKVSQDRNAITPYAKQAQKYGDPSYASGLGGKLDDVSCVIVSYG
jgi:protein phosphatase PTC7